MTYQQVSSIKLEEENRKIPCQPKQVVKGCDRAAGRSVRDPLKEKASGNLIARWVQTSPNNVKND